MYEPAALACGHTFCGQCCVQAAGYKPPQVSCLAAAKHVVLRFVACHPGILPLQALEHQATAVAVAVAIATLCCGSKQQPASHTASRGSPGQAAWPAGLQAISMSSTGGVEPMHSMPEAGPGLRCRADWAP